MATKRVSQVAILNGLKGVLNMPINKTPVFVSEVVTYKKQNHGFAITYF